ncbi:hypothetical protein pdam_00024066 [Pocillopora damicornis]|uniref:Serine aminopeptidase S33 domain-containing protein n=1 Tax=Pocillopora damicornis TaxID=46731 RepID=A0A3M6TZR4_POCDA|nr:hypothetical protein pdam_00024066 [Pocillopora damicornis]
MSERVRQRATNSPASQQIKENKPKENLEKNKHERVLFKTTVGVILLFYITCVIIMYSSPEARELMIYLHPLKNPFENLSDPSSFGLPDSTVHFYISGPAGKLGAWNIPSQNADKAQDTKTDKHSHLSDGNPVFLYFHGNAYTRGTGHRLGVYKLLTSIGYHVVTIDYRGFGDSEGKPSENGLIEDGLAAWKWIRSQSPEAPLYIWGHSLGSGVAGGVAKALCEEDFKFCSEFSMLMLPFRFLPYFNETVLEEVKDAFRTDKRLADVYCPILILHDRSDEIISFALGKKLYESAKFSRPADAGPIKFIELDGQHGHKMIYQSQKLPGILREFVRTN